MTDFRLINAPIQKISEEESFHMHKEVNRTFSGAEFWKIALASYNKTNPDFLSVLTFASNGVHCVSLRDWIMQNEKYYRNG